MGGVYIGVGPEQNFSYIAALRPQMAFVVDIRRQNMIEHLMYKALFELSEDRAEFLSRLFSRPRPAGLDRHSTVADLFKAFATISTDRPPDNQNARTRIHAGARGGPSQGGARDPCDLVLASR